MTSGLAQPGLLEHPAHLTDDARVDDPPPSSRAAVDRALRIVVLVWTGAWIPLMAFLEVDSENPTSPISATMLAALMVGWVVVVAARLPINGWYVAALAGTALVQATLTEPVGLWAESSLLITWTNLAALCCGFTIAGARGRLAVAVIAGTQLTVLTSRAWIDGTVSSAWPGVVAAAAYALADGMAAHVAASAVRTQADSTDVVGDQLALERRSLATRGAELRETERVSRVLHDTVLNTLGAIRRGVDPAEVEAVRARCALDLRELRGLRDRRFEATGDTGVRADAVLRALGARAAVLSLTLDVRGRVSTSASIPTGVADAVSGACGEALVNVAKHSGTRAAALDLDWDGAVLAVEVHDDGRGWSGELPPERGVARSIMARAADAGIEALVVTAPGAGTTVSLTWRAAATSAPVPPTPPPAAAAPGPRDADPAVARVLASVAVRAGGWVAGLLAFITLVFWDSLRSVTAILALAILGGVLLLSWQVGVRRGRVPITARLATLLVGATFLVTALPARDAATCDQLAEGWWGLDGAVVVLLSLVLLTRGWWWTAAGSAAMVAGALSLYVRETPIPAECLGIPAVNAALEASIVIAIVIFREALLRLWSAAAESRARSDRLCIMADVREATDRARDARVDVVLAATVPLLDTLARGLVDPTDDGVRQHCATSEAALRALLRIGPAHDWLGDLLGEAVLGAYARGRILEVMPTLGPVRLPGESAAEPLRALVREVVDRTPPGGVTTAALITGAEGSILTLVSDSRLGPLPVGTGRGLQRAGLVLEAVRTGEQSLVEVRW